MDKQLSLPAIPATLRPRKSRQRGYKRNDEEYRNQCAFFDFLRRFKHLEPKFGMVFAVPNGLALQPKVASASVASGTLAGVWDCCIPYGGYMDDEQERWVWVLWMEFKAGKNDLTEEQKKFRDRLPTVYGFVVVRSWIDAARVACEYLNVENETILEAIR